AALQRVDRNGPGPPSLLLSVIPAAGRRGLGRVAELAIRVRAGARLSGAEDHPDRPGTLVARVDDVLRLEGLGDARLGVAQVGLRVAVHLALEAGQRAADLLVQLTQVQHGQRREWTRRGRVAALGVHQVDQPLDVLALQVAPQARDH